MYGNTAYFSSAIMLCAGILGELKKKRARRWGQIRDEKTIRLLIHIYKKGTQRGIFSRVRAS